MSKSGCPLVPVSTGLSLRQLTAGLKLSRIWQRNLRERYSLMSHEAMRSPLLERSRELCDKRPSPRVRGAYLCSMILAFGTSFQNWASSCDPTLSISAAMTKNLSCGEAWDPVQKHSGQRYSKKLKQLGSEMPVVVALKFLKRQEMAFFCKSDRRIWTVI